VENDLQTAQLSADGIEKLFQEYNIPGYEQPVAELKKQLAQYTEFLRTEVLPRARSDFRLVPEVYAFRLEQFGVHIPPAQLPARIRIGTPAENAQQPAPHFLPPRLIGNTGEEGEFVLPLSVPGAKEQKYDDFNYDAASWTLTAHEARPGHELQFSTMVEKGVS